MSLGDHRHAGQRASQQNLDDLDPPGSRCAPLARAFRARGDLRALSFSARAGRRTRPIPGLRSTVGTEGDSPPGLDRPAETPFQRHLQPILRGRPRHKTSRTTAWRSCRQFWLLTRRVTKPNLSHEFPYPTSSRQVLEGLTVDFRIQGTFHPRDFCVQYRETDFNFACRAHGRRRHLLLLSGTRRRPYDGRGQHPGRPTNCSRMARPLATSPWQFGDRQADQITSWEKTQELRPGQVHALGSLLRAASQAPEGRQDDHRQRSGRQRSHTSSRSASDEFLEVYDYPGEYAQRFDGVDPGGGDRPPTCRRSSRTTSGQSKSACRKEPPAASDPGPEPLQTPGKRPPIHPRRPLRRRWRLRGDLR